MFLSSGQGYIGELLELPQGCHGPFRGSRGKVGILEMPQWKRASSHVEGRISWFFLSCGKKVGVPLELQLGFQGPAHVASGKSSLHASCEGPLRIPLQSVPGSRSSSGVVAKTSVLPFNADMDLGVPIEFQQGNQASSPVETCKFAFLSSSKSSVRVPVE